MDTAVSPSSVAFGPLTIRYDDRVLEPRPWTFGQSAWAGELARAVPGGPIAELGCGAGQIGLAAAVISDRALVQVDTDPVACAHARLNASFAGRRGDVEVRRSRIADAFERHERFPLILADPPYVASREVVRFPRDPVVAIDGGADGLDRIDECLDAIAAHLHERGVALVQVRGLRQAVAVEAHGAERSLRLDEVRCDGPDRAIVALRLDG